MKTFIKTLVAAGMLIATSANAAVISVNVSSDANAEANFLSLLGSIKAQESFNGLGATQQIGSNQHESWENKASVFNTNVGTFELITAGQGTPNVFNNELMIESDATGEFGREVSLSAGDFWLDSNDARLVNWTLGGPLTGNFNAFGFYLYDASDVSANLSLTFEDSVTANIGLNTVLNGQTNGNVKFVTVISDANMLNGTLTFKNSSANDGWGINNVTVGTLPEPGSVVLMSLGLLGLGLARRRTAKQEAKQIQ